METAENFCTTPNDKNPKMHLILFCPLGRAMGLYFAYFLNVIQ